MTDAKHRFTPGPVPKFPMLVMRAFTGPESHAEWVFTPPEGAGWFDYKFEAMQENGVLYINFDRIMSPRAPE